MSNETNVTRPFETDVTRPFEVIELRNLKHQDLLGGHTVYAADTPGHGGANHRYIAQTWAKSEGEGEPKLVVAKKLLEVNFQKGPVAENGINGVQIETLLSIAADHLEGFQAGPYPSADNAEALTHIERAIECLQRRTRDRMARGVEGKSAA